MPRKKKPTRRMRAPRNPLHYVTSPSPDPADDVKLVPSALAAVGLADKIQQRIDDLSDRAKLTNPRYFEDVSKKAEGIADVIRRTNRVSDAQVKALENMLEGVEKWHHNPDCEED